MQKITAQVVADSLGGKRTGTGFLCKCPAHDDTNASLMVSDGENGRLLVNCKVGCSFSQIHNALFRLNLWPKLEKHEPRMKEVARYVYSCAGGERFSKIRFLKPDGSKTFLVECNGEKKLPRNIEPLLYGSENLNREGMVFVCEGEKDVDNVSRLGLIAVTNYEGASAWKPRYTEQLKGREVVILEDNDAAGRKRTGKLIEALKGARVLRLPGLPEKGDVSDWLQAGGTKEELVRLAAESQAPGPVDTYEMPLGRDYAQHDDYIKLMTSLPVSRELVVDQLDGELYSRGNDEIWRKTENLLDYFAGCAINYGDFFRNGHLKFHLARYRYNSAPVKLRIEIPEWDGIDRLAEIAAACEFENVTQDDFYELIGHWGAGIFKRLEDASIQPFTPILQGAQGLGKDSLIDALTGGLGDYRKRLRIARPEEAERDLHTALVFTIPEFDRTSKTEIATLKDLLTTSSTTVRLAYDKRSESRSVRASFIASCNLQDVLADHTGNRRFWVLRCKSLGLETEGEGEDAIGTGRVTRSYPGLWGRELMRDERLQIVAQFRALAKSGYSASAAVINRMRIYIQEQRPQSVEAMIVEEYQERMKSVREVPARRSHVDGCPTFAVNQIDELLSILTRSYGRSKQSILRVLSSCGLRERSDGSFYRSMTAEAWSNHLNSDQTIF